MKIRNTMQWMLAGSCLLGACSLAQAQVVGAAPVSLPSNPAKVVLPEGASMQTILYEAQLFAGDLLPFALLDVLPAGVSLRDIAPVQFATVQDELDRRGISLRNDGRVNVEIIGQQGQPAVNAQLIEAVGGHFNGEWQHRRDVWIPIHQLTNLALTLPEGYFMQRVGPLNFDGHGQGPTVTNADTYIAGGADGTGITIAVIDGGYQQLVASQNMGHAPTGGQVTTLVCSGASCTEVDADDDDFVSSTNHGTGCVEAAFSSAPGANYRIYTISSITHMALAVQDAIINGAHIATHSLSRYNQGWADNTGDAVAVANAAADAGMLFFTSAGNRACQHWQGTMNPDGDGWHRFSGSDITNTITLADGAGGGFYLQWNTAGGTFDYDLYLFDSNMNELAKSTNSGNTFEEFSYTNNTGGTQTVHLAVLRDSGGNTEFELFFHAGGCNTCSGCNFEYAVAASSTTSPSNSTRPNVISNAAVDWSQHTSPAGSIGIIQNYSSRGPTNSGAIRPDISGPTNTATSCCGGSFGGTSSATPNNAGVAAALWSAHPQFNADAIRWLMFEKAELWRDWGTPGKDTIYGHGGSILLNFVPDAVWLARGYNNVGNNPNGPFFTFQAAYNAAVNNGHIHIFPGGNYPEPFMSSASKNVRVETVENIAVLGAP
jgi:hypothetical protein